jgi:hypothetical protein
MNFADALSKAADEIKRPPNLPIGTYDWIIKKYEVVDRDEYEILEFQCQCTGVHDDVDPDDLATFGKAEGTPQRVSFIFNKADDPESQKRYAQTEFKLKRFLQDHVKCWNGGSLKTALTESVNQKFGGYVRWRPDRDDPEVQYAEISKTFPLG